MNIRHASFKHGWFYHYRVHLDKLKRLARPFPALEEYLHAMFRECPHEYFGGGPRSSKLQLPIDLDWDHNTEHELCSFTEYALEHGRFKTAHSNVQVLMLETDDKTVAVEVPLWIEPGEVSSYREVFGSDLPFTGHIDALSITDEKIWVWDYKPGAAKEKYAHVQTYMYALALSKRTGLSLEHFRCGYFDSEDCYVFVPPNQPLRDFALS